MEPAVIYSERLRSYLKKILRRTALLHIGSGLMSFCAAAAWVLVVLAIWTRASAHPSLEVTLAVSRTVTVLLTAIGFYFVIWPLIRMPRLRDLAAEVERRQDLHEMVRAGFEFSNDDEASRKYSPELVKEVIRQAVTKIEGLKVRFVFLGRRDLALLPVAYGGLVVLLLLSLFSPNVMIDAGQRIIKPAAAAVLEHRANIQVSPGNVTVLAGSDVTATGLDFGQTENEVTISYNLAEDFWKTEKTRHISQSGDGISSSTFDRYEYVFKDLRHSISYYFNSGDHKSSVYTITVVNEPILTELSLKLTPPPYTQQKEVVLTDNGGNVQALEGTRVEVVGHSNNELVGAWARFGNGEKTPVEVSGQEISFAFKALKDGHYSVLLEDTRGYKTRDPLVYSIEVFQDHPPALEVIEPGGDTTLPRNRLLDVGFIASDDYGVRSASIYYRRNGDQEFSRLGVDLAEQKGAREVAVSHSWDLSEISLFPGNYVEYFVQVADNNVVTGPGVTKSKVYQITVPTMAELYDKISEVDSERNDQLEQAIKDSKELQEDIEKIKREFIKTEKMEWAQKKELDSATEKQKQIEESLDQIKQSLEKTLQELADNDMTSQEIGEKMEEIRDLLKEIDNEELRKHMDELRKAAEKLDPEQIRKALENLDVDTEDMLKKLERTAALLKQIQKEQKMEEVVRKSKDLMDAQKELNDKTSESSEQDKSKMNELSREQDELSKKADDLQKSAEELSENMDVPEVSEQLEQMANEMKGDQGPQKNMKQASDELKQQEKQQAMQQQQQAMEKMISLFQKASQAQKQMQQQQGKQLAANFQKYARQTLELSFKQEDLANKLQSQPRGETRNDMQELAQEQMSYVKATEAVSNAIQKIASSSLAVSPTLMEALGEALSRMGSSVVFLEQSKPFMSTAHAHNAVESLNEATIEMLSSAKQCAAGNPQQGGQTTAQMLMEQLIPQQQDVLSQTQEMMKMEMLNEALRQQQQAQLDRLAGQQRSLQEIAREMEKEARDDRSMLGRLDKMIEDMELAAKSIQKGQLDEDLINREQRILSRMLDAERSVHTRDYEKKRQSTTAAEMFSRNLGKSAREPALQALREEIRRAMQLKAPGEFETLIKLYFRALADETSGARAD